MITTFSHSQGRSRLAATGSAFTLIELLTVIAIIGILAAIIIPTVGKVRQSAKNTTNLSNMRQIGMALNAYTVDNKGFFPPGADDTKPTGFKFWPQQLDSYLGASRVKGKAILKSPNADPDIPYLDSTQEAASTYSLNGGIVQEKNSSGVYYRGGAGAFGPLPLNRIQRPSQVILVADGNQTAPNGFAKLVFGDGTLGAIVFVNSTVTLSDVVPTMSQWDLDDASSAGNLRFRNSGKLHAAMADGSVRAFAKNELTYGNLVSNR
jgi:prepilin-type N-terminal cleavage/methylation domain-containing protein